jgi:hypothetical protein
VSEYYAGVGSRETPSFVLSLMRDIGAYFAREGWVLRSGAAKGADRAFESGCDRESGVKEIYTADSDIPPQAFDIAKKIHPAWNRCSPYAKKLHARNCMQVLGPDLLTPVKMVICWTKDGGYTGGTATAMRLADANNIPVFNLKFEKIKKQFREKIYG